MSDQTAPTTDRDQLADRNVDELRELAKDAEITGYSSMRKAELIDALAGDAARSEPTSTVARMTGENLEADRTIDELSAKLAAGKISKADRRKLDQLVQDRRRRTAAAVTDAARQSAEETAAAEPDPAPERDRFAPAASVSKRHRDKAEKILKAEAASRTTARSSKAERGIARPAL